MKFWHFLKTLDTRLDTGQCYLGPLVDPNDPDTVRVETHWTVGRQHLAAQVVVGGQGAGCKV